MNMAKFDHKLLFDLIEIMDEYCIKQYATNLIFFFASNLQVLFG